MARIRSLGRVAVRRARWRAGVAALCAGVGVVACLGGARAADAAVEPQGVARAARAQSAAAGHAPASASPEQAAVAAARTSGREVMVAGEQSATSAVYAEPDGSMRTVVTAVPTRVRQGAAWVSLDTALAWRADGLLAPRAVEEPQVLSGGGVSAPLVSLGSGAGRLDVYWPGT